MSERTAPTPDAQVDRALDALAAAPSPAAPPLGAALEAELAALAPAAPRRPLRQLALAIGGSLAYVAIVLGIRAVLAGPHPAFPTARRDLGELPAAWLAGAGAAWLAGFTARLYLARVPRRGTMSPRWAAAGGIAAALAVGFVAPGWFVHPRGPSSFELGFVHGGCFAMGLLTAIGPVALGAWLLRGALPVGSRWIAAALGAGGGCLGGLVLLIHCPIAERVHTAFVHGSVVAASAVVAALIAPVATDRGSR